MDLGIKNKIALVTGSSRGIGKAAAISLAKEGEELSKRLFPIQKINIK